MDDAYDFADKLMDMDNEIWDMLGLCSRPTGTDRLVYFLVALGRLRESGIDISRLTPEVDAILENENFHSLSDVIDVFRGDVSFDDLMMREGLKEHTRTINLLAVGIDYLNTPTR